MREEKAMKDTDTKKFYGVKLTDATGKVYYTEVNVKQGLTHNINIQTHKPLSSKFPYSTIIGKNFYWSGTHSGAFENNEDGECIHDYVLGDADFRIGFVEWLFLSSKIVTLSPKIKPSVSAKV